MSQTPSPRLEELELELRELVKSLDSVETIADLMFPDISGYPEVKYGILCMLANPWDDEIRERIHVLLFGKPGTGKTRLMDTLEIDHDALYISMEATTASLKGDARKEDLGIKIFNECDGGIVCIDDIEKMKNIDVLRDVMEKGIYTHTKGGEHIEFTARDRIVAATNDISHMPPAIRNRFDLIFMFDLPTITQSMDIVRQMLYHTINGIDYSPFLKHYIDLVKAHEPATIEKKEIEARFQHYFEEHGCPEGDEEAKGKEGRWVAGVFRIAKANARLHLTNIGPEEITKALEMKNKSDETLRSIES